MSEPAARRFARPPLREASLPTEREWERAVLLEPRPVPRHPELISDGGGLPFAPEALAAPAGALDPSDPAVGALIARLARQKPAKAPSRKPWKRAVAPPPPPPPRATPSVEDWRMAARTDDEVLFLRGRPPHLVTMAVRRGSRRAGWTCVAVSSELPLRATRDGIRASSWRLDPTGEPDPAQRVLRVLITEQTWSGGKRADGRLAAPDLHVGVDELVLTTYITPRPGFQVRMRNPETPARIALPGPIGSRAVIDGALYAVAPGTGPPGTPGTGPS